MQPGLAPTRAAVLRLSVSSPNSRTLRVVMLLMPLSWPCDVFLDSIHTPLVCNAPTLHQRCQLTHRRTTAHYCLGCLFHTANGALLSQLPFPHRQRHQRHGRFVSPA